MMTSLLLSLPHSSFSITLQQQQGLTHLLSSMCSTNDIASYWSFYLFIAIFPEKEKCQDTDLKKAQSGSLKANTATSNRFAKQRFWKVSWLFQGPFQSLKEDDKGTWGPRMSNYLLSRINDRATCSMSSNQFMTIQKALKRIIT